jgi:hypothetical protein
MGTYVEVRRETIEGFLADKGFRREIAGKELVYIRDHHVFPALKIKVWTSLPAQEGRNARGRGQDAIRVTVAYEGSQPMTAFGKGEPRTSFGIFKATRIFRTGSEAAVLERLYERMREAYQTANEWVRQRWPEISRLPETKK